MLKENFKNLSPKILIKWYHFLMAFLGALICGFPSKKIKVIGITGTKGKTTTVELIKSILEQAGFKTASISSARFTLGEKNWINDLKMTMPGRLKIQRFLKQAVSAGCKYIVFEVTSEGVLQYRQKFIDFEAAVFTNLAPEHIERHGSFENYREAKGKFFRSCKKKHIINIDDGNADYFLKFPAKEKWGYGCGTSNKLQNPDFQMLIGENYKTLTDGTEFSVKNIDFNLKLLGEFNVYNALAAIGVGLSQGVSLEACKKALEDFKGVAGRMETIFNEPFRIIIDYAHTPDSLEKVYQTLTMNLQCSIPKERSLPNFIGRQTPNKLICVLGSAGGGRDKWKRSEMGKIAAKYCDEIILTNEDPYDENPLKIIEDIESGFSQIPDYKFQIINYKKILDRKEAIHVAIKSANFMDTVIITGKGSECWMCVSNSKKLPWSDRAIVEEAIVSLKNKTVTGK